MGRLVVDETELGVAIGVPGPFDRLGRRLERVAHLMQELADRPRRHLVTHVAERSCQLARRLQRPTQRRHRVPSCIRLHQVVEVGEQVGIDIDQPRPTPTLAAHPLGGFDRRVNLLRAGDHGVAAHAGNARYEGGTPSTQRPRQASGQQAPLLLIEMRRDEREQLTGRLLAQLHQATIRPSSPLRADS